MAGRMEGGYVPPSKEEAARVYDGGQRTPEQIMAATPAETTLQEITPTSRYVKAPEEALAMASTGLGAAALKDRPVLAARLAEMLKTPETKTMEFGDQLVNITGGEATPITMGGQPLSKPAKPKTPVRSTDFGGFVREYYNDGSYQDVKKTLAPSGPRDEPLMSIVGPDGKPILARRSEAEGKQPFFATMGAGTQATGDSAVDRRKYRENRQSLQNAMDALTGFATQLKNTPREESITGDKAGRLSASYKLALGAVRELQNTGVLNPGELPFIEDTLRDPQSMKQLLNPAARETITGQLETIGDLLNRRAQRNDEMFGYDVKPLSGAEMIRRKQTRSKF
jgi:hypothetical protein